MTMSDQDGVDSAISKLNGTELDGHAAAAITTELDAAVATRNHSSFSCC